MLKDIVTKQPFNDRLILDDISAIKNLATGKVLLCVSEQSYFDVGKAIKGYIDSQFKVETLIISGDIKTCKNSFLESEFDVVIACGDEFIVNACRYYSQNVIAIVTTPIFDYMFAKSGIILNGGIIERQALSLPQKVLLDIKYLATIKKEYLADSFCYNVARCLDYVSQKIEGIASGKEVSDKLDKVFNALLKLLNSITGKNYLSILIYSQLIMCDVVDECDSDSDLKMAGYILSKLSNSPINECAFRVADGYFNLIKLYLGVGKTKIIANTIKDCIKLSSLLGVDDVCLLKKANQCDFGVLDGTKEDVIKACDFALSYINGLNVRYTAIYNSKKKRCDFSFDDKRLSLKFAGMLSNGILNNLYKYSICDLLEKL